jgi:hypothetical protein
MCNTVHRCTSSRRMHALHEHPRASFVPWQEEHAWYRNAQPSLLLAAMLLPPPMLVPASSITADGCNRQPPACVWYCRLTCGKPCP